MEISEVLSWLSEGVDEATAATLKGILEKDAVKSKFASVKAQREYEAIQAQAAKVAALEEELDAQDAAGNPRGYRAWYKKHGDAVVAQAKQIAEFEAKHGAGTFAKLAAGEFQLPSAPSTTPTGAGMTEADVKKLIADNLKAGTPLSKDEIKSIVAEQFQQQFAPSTANTVVTAGHLIQRHMLAGRKNPIDFNVLAKTANEKYAGDMDRAYDEWDKPERDKEIAAAETAKIQAAVAAERKKWDDERLQEKSKEKFPGGADFTPGNLSHHKDAATYDKNAQMMDLAKGWATAGDEKVN